MTDEHRLKLLLFPLALLSIGVLALVPGVLPPFIGAFALILLPGFFLNPKNEPFSGYTIAWHAAVILFLAWTTLHLLTIGRPLHITLAYQISFVILYRMLTPKKPRHYYEVWYWCLSAMVLAGFWSTSVLFILAAVTFTILSVFIFYQASVIREKDRLTHADVPQEPLENKVKSKRQFRPVGSRAALPLYLGALSLIILISASTMFFVLPRGGLSHLPALGTHETDDKILLTGLSDVIELGSLGRILKDDSEALRIKTEPALVDESALYLRGGVLDFFDGDTWQKSQYLRHSPIAHTVARESDKSQPANQDKGKILQHISYTDIDTYVVYSLPGISKIEIDRNDSYSINPAGVVLIRSPEREFGIESTSWDWPRENLVETPLLANELNSKDTPEENPTYLQVPENLRNVRFSNYAARITGDSGQTPLEKAKSIEKYFVDNFEYTLDLRSYTSNNPIEEFLFEEREGHCELFATAMTMMLRSEGIPARLVSGFHGGEANPEEGLGAWIVRKSDVHTWVEAWIPDQGWCMFEPTPPAPLEVLSGSLTFLALRDWMEQIQRNANVFIFAYDRDRQDNILGTARTFLMPRMAPFMLIGKRGGLLILFAGAIVIFYIVVRYAYKQWRRKGRAMGTGYVEKKSRDASDLWLEWYRRRLTTVLGGSLRSAPPSATLREFTLSLAHNYQDVTAIEARRLSDTYYALRFGELPLTDELKSNIKLRLDNLNNTKTKP